MRSFCAPNGTGRYPEAQCYTQDLDHFGTNNIVDTVMDGCTKNNIHNCSMATILNVVGAIKNTLAQP